MRRDICSKAFGMGISAWRRCRETSSFLRRCISGCEGSDRISACGSHFLCAPGPLHTAPASAQKQPPRSALLGLSTRRLRARSQRKVGRLRRLPNGCLACDRTVGAGRGHKQSSAYHAQETKGDVAAGPSICPLTPYMPSESALVAHTNNARFNRCSQVFCFASKTRARLAPHGSVVVDWMGLAPVGGASSPRIRIVLIVAWREHSEIITRKNSGRSGSRND
jgi:hypothetical protein